MNEDQIISLQPFLTQQFTEARSPWLLRGQLLLFSLSAGWEIMITANV